MLDVEAQFAALFVEKCQRLPPAYLDRARGVLCGADVEHAGELKKYSAIAAS